MTPGSNRRIAPEPLPVREYRTDDARLDAFIEDYTLREAGVLESDQPTEYSDYTSRKAYNAKAFGEFTAQERGAIRQALGLEPFDA